MVESVDRDGGDEMRHLTENCEPLGAGRLCPRSRMLTEKRVEATGAVYALSPDAAPGSHYGTQIRVAVPLSGQVNIPGPGDTLAGII